MVMLLEVAHPFDAVTVPMYSVVTEGDIVRIEEVCPVFQENVPLLYVAKMVVEVKSQMIAGDASISIVGETYTFTF